MKTKQVSVLPVDKVGTVEEQEDGNVAMTFLFGEGEEFGLLMPPAAASELSGALIERHRDGRGADQRKAEAAFERHVHVTTIEAAPASEEKYSLRIAVEDGPALTFLLGQRQVRRWRDMLTDQIERFERSQRQ